MRGELLPAESPPAVRAGGLEPSACHHRSLSAAKSAGADATPRAGGTRRGWRPSAGAEVRGRRDSWLPTSTLRCLAGNRALRGDWSRRPRPATSRAWRRPPGSKFLWCGASSGTGDGIAGDIAGAALMAAITSRRVRARRLLLASSGHAYRHRYLGNDAMPGRSRRFAGVQPLTFIKPANARWRRAARRARAASVRSEPAQSAPGAQLLRLAGAVGGAVHGRQGRVSCRSRTSVHPGCARAAGPTPR